jgi:methionyl-tRNA formyltransferase
MKNPKVLFAGTPEFALASLRAIVDAGVDPVAVLTQPDRPAGRGKRISASPVKRYAQEKGFAVLQPATLRDEAIVEKLRDLRPDLIIVAAYGLLLPQAVLDIPKMGCLNVHASLLPRWRGAAPIQAAILAGDESTGVCLMAMSAGLDCGPVYACDALRIGERETAGELHDRLAVLGGELLTRHIGDVLDGTINAEAQDEANVTYAGKVRTQDAAIDWRQSAEELQRLVRAYNPVPGAYFELDDMRVKCWAAESTAGTDAPPGTVTAAGRGGIVVSCSEGALRLLSLQRPGKRAVDAREFAAQFDLIGRCLG